MRDAFPEYYRPAPDIERLVSEATVALDTNVLLGLYQLGTSEREQVFDVLDKIKDRLWIPYQVGYEYHRNRLSVIKKQSGLYESAKAVHGTRNLNDMKAKLGSSGLPDEARKEIEPLLSDLEDQLRKAVKDFESAVEEIAGKHVAVTIAEAHTNDPVRDKLDDLLAGRVGNCPEEEKLEALIEKGLRRIGERIPPGYMDQSKDDSRARVADYLIWCEILDYAKQSERAVLFVTNDLKQDWYDRSSSGPRPELVAEFGRHSNRGYHQVTLSQFLKLASTHLSVSVDKATIDQVSSTEAALPVTPRKLRNIYKVLADLPPERQAEMFLLVLNMIAALKDPDAIVPRVTLSYLAKRAGFGAASGAAKSPALRTEAAGDDVGHSEPADNEDAA